MGIRKSIPEEMVFKLNPEKRELVEYTDYFPVLLCFAVCQRDSYLPGLFSCGFNVNSPMRSNVGDQMVREGKKIGIWPCLLFLSVWYQARAASPPWLQVSQHISSLSASAHILASTWFLGSKNTISSFDPSRHKDGNYLLFLAISELCHLLCLLLQFFRHLCDQFPVLNFFLSETTVVFIFLSGPWLAYKKKKASAAEGIYHVLKVSLARGIEKRNRMETGERKGKWYDSKSSAFRWEDPLMRLFFRRITLGGDW